MDDVRFVHNGVTMTASLKDGILTIRGGRYVRYTIPMTMRAFGVRVVRDAHGFVVCMAERDRVLDSLREAGIEGIDESKEERADRYRRAAREALDRAALPLWERL